MFNNQNLPKQKPQEFQGGTGSASNELSQALQKDQDSQAQSDIIEEEQQTEEIYKKQKKKRTLDDLTEEEIQIIFQKNRKNILASEEQMFVQCSKIKLVDDQINKKYWLRFCLDRYYCYDEENKCFIDPFNKKKQFETQQFADFLLNEVFKKKVFKK